MLSRALTLTLTLTLPHFHHQIKYGILMADQGFVLQQLSDIVVGLQNDLWNHKKFRIIDGTQLPPPANE